MDIDLYVAELAALDLGCIVLFLQRFDRGHIVVAMQVNDPDWEDDGEVFYLKVKRRLH